MKKSLLYAFALPCLLLQVSIQASHITQRYIPAGLDKKSNNNHAVITVGPECRRYLTDAEIYDLLSEEKTFIAKKIDQPSIKKEIANGLYYTCLAAPICYYTSTSLASHHLYSLKNERLAMLAVCCACGTAHAIKASAHLGNACHECITSKNRNQQRIFKENLVSGGAYTPEQINAFLDDYKKTLDPAYAAMLKKIAQEAPAIQKMS